MEEQSSLDFNFWTAFADLMLALVLVLCIVLFAVKAVISLGSVNLKTVETNQRKMVDSIAQKYNTVPVPLDKDLYGISTSKKGDNDIQIFNDLSSQRITFSDKLLFQPDGIELNADGQVVLTTVGNIIRQQLPQIKEIQIQGHADTNRSNRYPSNTHLAAMRAIAVFEFLQKKLEIDPAKNLMSATTFGEFRSVQRGRDNPNYSLEQLLEDNATDSERGRNRRIEIVLNYRR